MYCWLQRLEQELNFSSVFRKLACSWWDGWRDDTVQWFWVNAVLYYNKAHYKEISPNTDTNWTDSWFKVFCCYVNVVILDWLRICPRLHQLAWVSQLFRWGYQLLIALLLETYKETGNDHARFTSKRVNRNICYPKKRDALDEQYKEIPMVYFFKKVPTLIWCLLTFKQILKRT